MKTSNLLMIVISGSRRLLVAIPLLLLVGCNSDEASLNRFGSLRQQTSKAVEKMIASSYLYRLDVTQEEQEMQDIMNKVRSGSAGFQTLMKGLNIERSRREKYIDPFEADIEALRDLTSQITEVSQTLRDTELRTAALKVSAHYGRLAELCGGMAAAQRKRSALTERLLKALIKPSATGRLRLETSASELGDADRQGSQNRSEVQRLYPQETVLWAEFKGIRQRKKSAFSFLSER